MGDCTSVCNKSAVLEVSEELGEHFYFFKCLLVLSILLSFHFSSYLSISQILPSLISLSLLLLFSLF